MSSTSMAITQMAWWAADGRLMDEVEAPAGRFRIWRERFPLVIDAGREAGLLLTPCR